MIFTLKLKSAFYKKTDIEKLILIVVRPQFVFYLITELTRIAVMIGNQKYSTTRNARIQ